MRLKACAFDLGNTLIDDRNLREHAVKDVALWLHRESMIADPEEFATVYHEVNRADNTPFVSHTYGEPHFFAEALRRVGANAGSSPEEVLEKYREFVLAHTEADPDVIAALEYLREQGLTLALISNESVSRVDAYFTATGTRGLYDHVLVSQDVGIEKPNLDIFKLALETMGIDGPEMAMFGDNDIADGACKELGITYAGVMCYRSPGAPLWEQGEAYKPDTVVQRVSRDAMEAFLDQMYSRDKSGVEVDRRST